MEQLDIYDMFKQDEAEEMTGKQFKNKKNREVLTCLGKDERKFECIVRGKVVLKPSEGFYLFQSSFGYQTGMHKDKVARDYQQL